MLRSALLFLLAFLLPVAARGQFTDFWRHDPQDTTRQNLWSIAYGDRTLVTVGEQGTILSYNYSSDAPAWVPQVTGTDVWLVGVGFAAGRFVVVGDRGTILTSDNAGTTWTHRSSGTTARLNAVVHGNGEWLAVGEQGSVLVSSDHGVTWSPRPRLGTGFLRALAFSQGRFLIGGANGALFTTTDGITFSPVPIATTADIEGAAISANRFFVVGSHGLRAVATQLGAWTFGPPRTQTFRGVAVRNAEEASAVGEFANETFIIRPDGGAWAASFIVEAFLATAVAQGENEVVHVGFGGRIARSDLHTLDWLVPSPSRAIHGQDVRFSVVTGRAVASYQWMRNGVEIPGATHSTYTLRNVTPVDSTAIGVRITTSTGTTHTAHGGRVVVVPGGRPEVRDPHFHSALPTLPTVVVPQPDGKLLVAGQFTVTPDGGSTHGIARLNADGSLDRGFRVEEGVPPTESITAIRLLPDGRTYVLGSFTRIAGQPRPGLARLMPNGAIDTTFLPAAAVAAQGIVDLAPAPGGGLYVQTATTPSARASVLRLTADGAQDEAFIVLENRLLVGVDSLGRVLARRFPPPLDDGHLLRYLADGSIDNSYTEVAPPPFTNGFLETRVVTDAGVYTRGHTGRISRTFFYTRIAPDGGIDPGYQPPPDSTQYDFGSSYRADGAFWMPRDGFSPHYEPVFYAPSGAADSTRYATLPNLARYRIYAYAPDGSIVAVEDAVDGVGPRELIRIRPIDGRVGRLTNLSVRAFVPSGDSPLVAGFVTRGNGTTRAIVRGVGPSLEAFGVAEALRDPQLAIVRNGVAFDASDDWNAALAPRFTAVGAFPLADGSKDAALESAIGEGDFTAVVTAATADSGTALIEVYESTDDATPTRRFINVSARGGVAPSRPLIVGFAITGEVPLTVLVRGVGPALAGFGVSDVLADPRLMLYRDTTPLWDNDNWIDDRSQLSVLRNAFTRTGAFPLSGGSNDAAMLVTLAPGSYTAVLTGADNASGTALVEVYAVQ